MMKKFAVVAFLGAAVLSFAQSPQKADGCAACEAKTKLVASQQKATKACCQSTATKVVAKGSASCCNASSKPAAFKVFVSNEGYKFFGCEMSAKQGHSALAAKGKTVGKVQKVSSKKTLVGA